MTARRRRENRVMKRAEDWGARDEDHEQRVRSLEFLKPEIGTHSWMCLSTQSIGWESDGSNDTVGWYAVYISDNGFDYFDYEVVPDGGQFGDDIVKGIMKQSGIYTFSAYFQCGDIEQTTPFEFLYHLKFGGNANIYPGVISGAASGVDVTGTAAIDDFHHLTSVTIPVYKAGELTSSSMETGQLRVNFTAPVDTYFWTVRLWIVRHGPLAWTGGFSNQFTDPTWVSDA